MTAGGGAHGPGEPVTVVIPAYNEEGLIGRQIEAVRQALAHQQIEHEIVVVDDGSVDATAAEAARLEVRLLRHVDNQGYGAALKTGIQAAANEVIVISDADGTYPAGAIPNLVRQLATADMVVGSRTGPDVHLDGLRQPAKWLLRVLAAHIAGQKIPDLNSGLRAFRRRCVQQYFPVLPDRFSFTSTVTLAYMADNYRVIYQPINYYRRQGQSKIAPWHFLDFIVLILRMSMMFNPLRVFVPLALICGALGLLKVVYDIAALFARHPEGGAALLLQPVLSTSALLLLFAGLQFLMFGMVADGVVRRLAQYGRPLAPSHGSLLNEANQASLAEEQEPTAPLPEKSGANA